MNFKNSKEKILVNFFFSNIHNLLLAYLHFSSDSVRMKTSPDSEDNHYLGMQDSRIPNYSWNIIMAVILSQQEKVKNEIFSLKTVKVLVGREVDFNFLDNFTCTEFLFV